VYPVYSKLLGATEDGEVLEDNSFEVWAVVENVIEAISLTYNSFRSCP
jgi:hypothetical protein